MSHPESAPAVHKFGGAALADAAAIRHAAHVLSERIAGPTVVVASAMLGVTDALLELATRAARGADIEEGLDTIAARHREAAAGLRLAAADAAAVGSAIDAELRMLARALAVLAATRALSPAHGDAVVAHGERLGARLFAAALRAGSTPARRQAGGTPTRLLDALDVVHTDGRHGDAAPDVARTTVAARAALAPVFAAGAVAVVPGFIGRTPSGAVATLGRGGSDLTATLLGRVLEAREVVLWKDVPGFLTADPRIVPEARLIPTLHPREAAELAYFGAKVLHPRALAALGARTPLFIRPFAEPDASGTEISTRRATGGARRPVRALSSVGAQALVTIVGTGMVGVPGVAARLFGALERAGISVAFISQASSERSICIGLPSAAAHPAARALREAFAAELARGEIDAVEVRDDVALMAVVGLGMAGTPGVAARLFGAIGESGVNVVAIAQGASELNISLVVDGRDAATALRAVHAAFRLDKIGGGSAGRTRHADVVLLGFGQIGRELIGQLAGARDASAERGERVRVVAVIDRSGYAFDPRGLSAARLAALAKAKRDGVSLADAPNGVAGNATDALARIAQHALSRPVLVDVTAGDTGALLDRAVSSGMHLVLANKRPLTAGGAERRVFARRAAERGSRVLHEATVGAGLPIIDTFHKLSESGDRVLRIEGCPSGTLGYLFGALGRGTPFSAALRAAMALGYTEPDPRDDLSGMDVARKALILGQMMGYRGDLADVKVESLVPEAYASLPLEAFLSRLEEMDEAWARRVAEARAGRAVLRYRATVTRHRAAVGVVAVDAASGLAALSGTDNQFSFTTARYRANPLVITGPGAGAAVTAAGVMNDILKVAGGR